MITLSSHTKHEGGSDGRTDPAVQQTADAGLRQENPRDSQRTDRCQRANRAGTRRRWHLVRRLHSPTQRPVARAMSVRVQPRRVLRRVWARGVRRSPVSSNKMTKGRCDHICDMIAQGKLTYGSALNFYEIALKKDPTESKHAAHIRDAIRDNYEECDI